MKKRKIQILLTTIITAAMLAACGQDATGGSQNTANQEAAAEQEAQKEDEGKETQSETTDQKTAGGETAAVQTSHETEIDPDNVFTDRDLEQSPDLSGATELTLKDGEDINIDKEGIYVISGSAQNATITVEAGEDDKVQIVLKGAAVTNQSRPCIYVKQADKVFVTSEGSGNVLTVTGSFESDGDTKTDAVIFSKEDLVINGSGSLEIASSDNGISSKDDLKVTGGSLTVSCSGSALEAHDMIAVTDVDLNVTECNDGLHAENSDDDTKGCVYIAGGNLTIHAADDAIHATTVVRIDNGTLTLEGKECIEGTYVLVNDGTIQITASDDGINAAAKSSAYSPLYEQNGGSIAINMGAGDTDGVDSNGDILINGGTLDITGQSTFDYDGTATYNGGTIIENGQTTNTITNQDFGGMGGMKGGHGFGEQNGEMPQRPDFDTENGQSMEPPTGEMPQGQMPDGTTEGGGNFGGRGPGPKGGMKPGRANNTDNSAQTGGENNDSSTDSSSTGV